MGSKKQVVIKKSPNSKQTNTENYSSETLNSIWKFDKLDKNGDFKFDINATYFDHKDFVDKMINYSNMTWADIKKQTHDKKNKSKNHFLSLEKLSKEALERVKKLGYDESYPDSIFSFAFNNLTRVIGIKINEYFHVVWYDKNHQFCPVTK